MDIVLTEFDDINFLENNPVYIKRVYEHRYNNTNYSIIQEGKTTWVIYIIDEELGIFELLQGYHTKKDAIKEIESGKLKEKLYTQKIILDRLVKIL